MLETQRPHSGGCAACAPTSPRWCQQRTHLTFVVGCANTPIAPFASASGTTRTSPLISRKRSSSASGDSQFWSDTPQRNSTSACSAAPISPAARIGSSTLATWSRSCSSASKSVADNGASSGSGANPSYQVANSTLPARSPGICGHISSAVKLSTGAIQRTNASVMRNIADCALRRPRESSPIVYRRSLVTSRYSDPRSTLQKFISDCTTAAKS